MAGHQWSVWSAWKDYTEYRNDNARFVTEFGFQAPANLKTMEECTDPGDRHPQVRVIEHHNKQTEGTERLIRFMAGHFRVSLEYPRFIYLGQLVQGEALRCAVEHWRRRKFRTAGALFWQLNDCWPVSSWAVVDSALRPKAAYFFAKRFFAPILVSFTQVRDRVEVWVTNDRHERVSGELTVTRLAFDGRISREQKTRIHSAGDSSRCLVRLDALMTSSREPLGEYLRAAIAVEGAEIAENRHYFDEPKHLLLPEPGLSTSLREESRGRFVLEVNAERLAKYVMVGIEGEDMVFDDNFFDIDPGKTREIRFRSSTPVSELRDRIRLNWL